MSAPDYVPYSQYGWHPPTRSVPGLPNVNEMDTWGESSRSIPSSPASQISVFEYPHRIDIARYKPSHPESLPHKLPASVQLIPSPTNGPGWISSQEGVSRTGPSMTIQPRAHTSSTSPSLSTSTSFDSKPKHLSQHTLPIRCFQHQCNGRSFSSPGNYVRHLREKSGLARSFSCEMCGKRFTRLTAKNKHVRDRRCS